MRSIEPTEVPPNFWTIKAMLQGEKARILQDYPRAGRAAMAESRGSVPEEPSSVGAGIPEQPNSRVAHVYTSQNLGVRIGEEKSRSMTRSGRDGERELDEQQYPWIAADGLVRQGRNLVCELAILAQGPAL